MFVSINGDKKESSTVDDESNFSFFQPLSYIQFTKTNAKNERLREANTKEHKIRCWDYRIGFINLFRKRCASDSLN